MGKEKSLLANIKRCGGEMKGEGYFWYLVKSENECGPKVVSMHF